MTSSIFVDVVDDLVRISEDDPDLAKGLRWIDAQAQRRGISFYEMIFEVLYKCDNSGLSDTIDTPSEWLKRRN